MLSATLAATAHCWIMFSSLPPVTHRFFSAGLLPSTISWYWASPCEVQDFVFVLAEFWKVGFCPSETPRDLCIESKMLMLF